MASLSIIGAFLAVVKSSRSSANPNWSKFTNCVPRLGVGWFPFEIDDSTRLVWFKAIGTELGSECHVEFYIFLIKLFV